MQTYEHVNRVVKMGQFIYQSSKNGGGGAYRKPGSAEKGSYSGRTSVPSHI